MAAASRIDPLPHPLPLPLVQLLPAGLLAACARSTVARGHHLFLGGERPSAMHYLEEGEIVLQQAVPPETQFINRFVHAPQAGTAAVDVSVLDHSSLTAGTSVSLTATAGRLETRHSTARIACYPRRTACWSSRTPSGVPPAALAVLIVSTTS